MAYMFNSDKSKKHYVLEEYEFYLHTADSGSIAAGAMGQFTLKCDTTLRDGTDTIVGITQLQTFAGDGVCLMAAYPAKNRYESDTTRYAVDVVLWNCSSSTKNISSISVMVNFLRNWS